MNFIETYSEDFYPEIIKEATVNEHVVTLVLLDNSKINKPVNYAVFCNNRAISFRTAYEAEKTYNKLIKHIEQCADM